VKWNKPYQVFLFDLWTKWKEPHQRSPLNMKNSLCDTASDERQTEPCVISQLTPSPPDLGSVLISMATRVAEGVPLFQNPCDLWTPTPFSSTAVPPPPSHPPHLHTIPHCCYGSGDLWPLTGIYICYQLNVLGSFPLLDATFMFRRKEAGCECKQTYSSHLKAGSCGFVCVIGLNDLLSFV